MLKTESYRRGAISSTLLNVIVKGVLFLNTIVIAYYFGTSLETDIYFYIFSVITLIAGLINVMDLSVIIPEGMQVMEERGKSEAMKFYNFFGTLYMLIGIGLFLLFLFFSLRIYSSVSSFSTLALVKHTNLMLYSSALPLLIILSNYYTTVLTTLKYFTAPLVANGIAQVFALVSLLIFHDTLGIEAILIGMLIGYLLNILLLLFFMKIKLQWKFAFSSVQLRRRVKKNLLTVQLGNAANFIYNYGIIVLLSGLGTGIYSAYTYSMQIVNIPNSFIVGQVAAVAGIKFNEEAAKRRYHSLNRLFHENMRFILFLLMPICFLTWLYAESIVKLLFFRGTFDLQATDTVIFMVRFLIFLVPCIAINNYLSRLLMSVKKVNESFYFQVLFNLSTFFVIFYGTKLFELDGFLVAMVIMYYLYYTYGCFRMMKWLMPYIEYIGFLKIFLWLFLLNLPLFIISFYFFQYLFFIVPVFYIVSLFIINRNSNFIPVLNERVFKLMKKK